MLIRSDDEDRETAEAATQLFNQNNFHDVWVAGEQESLTDPSLEVQRGDRTWIVPGRWLRVHSTSGHGIAMKDRTFRGDLLVYLNDRGTLNLINEVRLDDYLRGVVPREMGPKIYDNLDALKAHLTALKQEPNSRLALEFNADAECQFKHIVIVMDLCKEIGDIDFQFASNEPSDSSTVETVTQEVNFPITQRKIDFDILVAFQKLANHRRDVESADGGARRDA